MGDTWKWRNAIKILFWYKLLPTTSGCQKYAEIWAVKVVCFANFWQIFIKWLDFSLNLLQKVIFALVIYFTVYFIRQKLFENYKNFTFWNKKNKAWIHNFDLRPICELEVPQLKYESLIF